MYTRSYPGQIKAMSNMKVSSLKYLLSILGFVACIAMTTSCNKGYGCPTDFSVDANIEAPASTLPSC